MTLSVCIITFNEESNIVRTLESVKEIADEIIIVDSGSTDATVSLAQARGAKMFIEPWKGFALQKNSSLAKATSEWILSLDADEEVSPELAKSIRALLRSGHAPEFDGYMMNRRNIYFGTWLKRCGYYPDPKLRLVKRGSTTFELRPVHEDMKMPGKKGHLQGDLYHHAYKNLEDFLEHQNRYSSLGAEVVVAKGKVGFSIINIVLRPLVRFLYSYFFRGGFLDGKVGLLVLMNHAMYVSWKYAKAWELSRNELSRNNGTKNNEAKTHVG